MSALAHHERSAALLALSPDGVAREVMWSRGTRSGLMTIAIDIGVRLLGEGERGPLDLAGATGRGLRDTLPRAAGEAVERFAVANLGGARDPSPRPAAVVPWSDLPSAARAGFPRRRGGASHLARDLRGGACHEVRLDLVDFPADVQAAWPGSPSGAAAHLSEAAATQAALLEVLERDGVMIAWFARRDVVELDVLPEMLTGLAAATLGGSADGGHLRLFRAPTAVAGVSCYLGWHVTDGACGCGAAAHVDDVRGGSRALREALQIGDLLGQLDDALGGRGAASHARVACEMGRARFWASSAGLRAFATWSDRLPRGRPCIAPAATIPDTAALVDALDPAVHVLRVDLTYRLPQPLRECGWSACKVIAPGLQPLITDEAAPWSAVPARIGRIAGDSAPHPLI